MKIKSADFFGSGVKKEQFPTDNNPEIVFIGKSNVGKSTLINKLLNRKGLAKTSSAPGKTRTVNFFKINESFYFVDLPGYGFAKVSKKERSEWKGIIEGYITDREPLKCILLLLDVRRDVTDKEKELFDWIKSFNIPYVTVFTKTDKLSKNKLNNALFKLKKELPITKIVAFSAINGDGKKELLDEIGQYI